MNKFTKFVVGTVAALALVLVAHASIASAAYMQTTTLKVGSKGTQVMSLQQTLDMTACSAGAADGSFGPHTKAAVQCFQAANGLTADGVVGPMTGAALAAVTGSTTVNTGMPAGCASTTGYSTTTGAPCSGTPGTTVFPAGCVSSVGYSSTTGVSCATGTTTTGGVVTSGPFSINSVTPVSGYSNTQVGVGSQDKVVGDLRIVSGAGGSGNLTGVNVSFFNKGNGDYQFIKYASAVSIWLNGVKVGTLPATSFTQYNSQYSAFIPVSGATLNPNTTNDLQLSITALPVIDSANLGYDTGTYAGNAFAYDLNTLRYTDSTGSYSYTLPNGAGFLGSGSLTTTGSGALTGLNAYVVFTNASAANSITLTVSKDANDYTDHVVAGQSGSNTTNVTLATIDLAAQGSAVTINRLPVTLVTSVSNSGSLINTLRLYNSSGTQVDSEPVAATGNNQVITFQNLNANIPAGSTQVYTIKGDVNAITGGNVGATARVDVVSANTSAIQAYDQNNNVLNNNSGQNILIGSTTGSVVTFYVNGINVTSTSMGTATASSAGGAQSHSVLGFTIPFSVTAFGQQAYVPSVATAANAATLAHNVQFCVDGYGGACQAVGTGVITYAGSDNLTTDNYGNYVIPAGQTKNFTLQITYTANGAASYRASLINVNFATANVNENTFQDGNVSGGSTYTAGLNSNSFRTNYVSAQ